MRLRPYQASAYDAIVNEFDSGVLSTLCVKPTGTGKTVLFASLGGDWAHGRVMVIAHREELVRQAARKFYDVTGEWPAIEKGSERSTESYHNRSQFVIASVASLHKKRLERFRDIGLLIIDEAHRAGQDSKSYADIITHLRSDNPNLRVLGVTATPNRHDRKKLLFDTKCFEYSFRQALQDGYLVEPKSMTVVVESLDLSRVPIDAGEKAFDSEVATQLEQDASLHAIADATLRECEDRKTVIFTASVRQAQELSRVLNGYQPGSANWLCGDRHIVPEETRRNILSDFESDRFQFIVNHSVLSEGWDSPRVGMLVMARPTRSHVLAMQMLGRGTRTLPGVVDDPLLTADGRRAAIEASSKPYVKVLDFVDMSRQHKLITTTDLRLLGGEYTPDEIELAKQQVEQNTQAGKVSDLETEAKLARMRLIKENQQKRIEEVRAAELARRNQAAQYQTGATNYSTEQVSLLDAYQSGPQKQVYAPQGKPPTEKQLKYLAWIGVEHPDRLSRKQASAIIVKHKNGLYVPKSHVAKSQKGNASKQGTATKSAPSIAVHAPQTNPHTKQTATQLSDADWINSQLSMI